MSSSLPFLDIGCGAGEFLSFVHSKGLRAIGVDMNEEEVGRCIVKGLDVRCADAVAFLDGYNGEFSGISLLQVIEHIPIDQHIRLLSLAHQKLSSGGVLIVETINPSYPLSFDTFFTDPTHVRPIPSGYLAFLAQWYGFSAVDVLYLLPAPVFGNYMREARLHYCNYAVIAQK
ncbi:MAG: class I SAM-dependent methyltransferase [Holosporales bacterium]|nr:class I SAM-dependent methyltransferase [Holosporales bacterium]